MPAAGTHDIAIIGFGFSGVLTLASLVRAASRPLRLVIFDPSPHAMRGPAYATTRPEYLLNVRASRMGAFADDTEGFYRWLDSNGKNVAADDFAPRCFYGDYLESVAQAALANAAKKNITVILVKEAVENIAPLQHGYDIRTTGGNYAAMALVLCTGNRFADASAGPWFYDYAALKGQNKNVSIIGSGLTAVDIMLSLLNAGFKGAITCVSRHGWLPQPHIDDHRVFPMEAWLAALSTGRLSERMRALRQAVKQAKSKGHAWQNVFDGLRAHTTMLWQTLTPQEQARFLKRCFTLWNIHRHRMPPQIHRQIMAAIASGQIVLKRTRDVATIADITFDCTGPRYNTPPAFLNTLMEQGRVQRHASGTGLSASADNRVSAPDAAPIFATGNLLVGQGLETTAVLSLRTQVAAIVSSCAQALH